MKYLKYISLLFCAMVWGGCSDFLEEYSQDTYYVTSYEDLNELLIGDCYCPVKGSAQIASSSNLGYFIHFLADEIEEQNGNYSTDYDNKEKIFGYYTWQERTGTKDNYNGYFSENGTWTEAYRLINVANNILVSVESVPQQTNEEKLGAMRVRGEAHFLRAAYYFFLVNLYGKAYDPSTASTDLGVPIKTIDKVNDVVYQRNSVQEVYDQILDDLQRAEQDLSQIAGTGSLYRADSTAVHFLKSRVYLYMQNWELAAQYADKVLAVHGTLYNMNTMTGAFLKKESVENLFSMGGNDLPCFMCNNYQSFRVSQELYNMYEEDDLRRTKWWWTYDDFIGYTKVTPLNSSWGGNDENAADYYYYRYYLAYESEKVGVSDKFLYRSAEAYLNKAEAEAYMQHESEARSALNELRKNRYVVGSDYEVTATGNELIQAIRDERCRELALEGHRWFDLRRYAVCQVYPQSQKITHRYTYYEDRGSEKMTECHVFVLEENDLAYTLPIPHNVLEYNTGMKNNERPVRTYTVEPVN